MENCVITVPEGIIKKQTDEAQSTKMTSLATMNATLIKEREDAFKNLGNAVEASPIVNMDSTKNKDVVTVDIGEKLNSADLEEILMFSVDSLMKNASQEVLSTATVSNKGRMYVPMETEGGVDCGKC